MLQRHASGAFGDKVAERARLRLGELVDQQKPATWHSEDVGSEQLGVSPGGADAGCG